MPAMRLSDCRKGQTVRVVHLSGTSGLRQRLMEMGFVRGTLVRVIRYAPLRDPLEVTVKGAHISLRVEEANIIEVTPVEEA